MEKENSLKPSKVALLCIVAHFVIMAAILFLMEPLSFIFSYDITVIPFIDKFPVMILWLIAMLGTLGFGLYKGTIQYKAGERSLVLRALLVLGYLSAAFWAVFFIGELVFPH